ncbi:unnamed protein product [Boreogadus saida]
MFKLVQLRSDGRERRAVNGSKCCGSQSNQDGKTGRGRYQNGARQRLSLREGHGGFRGIAGRPVPRGPQLYTHTGVQGPLRQPGPDADLVFRNKR